MKKIVELKAIKESTEDYDTVERRIKALLKKEIYYPLLRELKMGSSTLKNAKDSSALIDAIRSGQITFYRGTFSGKFSSAISRELKSLGASWDRKNKTFKINQGSLPLDVRIAASSSEFQFTKKLDAIDKKLAEISPAELAEKLKVSDAFDRTLWKVEKDFQASVKGITVAPQLTAKEGKRISAEWQTNMQLYIKDFTEKEIATLRKDMKESAFTGNRYGSMVKTIQESYGVSANKAKFLARQETSLLMAKYKQVRYQESGIDEYYWYHVAGSSKHPVRPIHKALGDAMDNGKKKIYRFSQPPIVDKEGNRKNPGQDYNCRCTARPIVRF